MSFKISSQGTTIECDTAAEADQLIRYQISRSAVGVAANDNSEVNAPAKAKRVVPIRRAPSLTPRKRMERSSLTISAMVLDVMNDGVSRQMMETINAVCAKFPGVKEDSVRTMICILRKNKKLSATGAVHSRSYKIAV